MSRDSQPPPASSTAEESTTLRDRLLRICPLVGLVAAAVILWQFGVTIWSAVAFVFLIAYPLVVVWGLVIARRQEPRSRKRP